MIYEWECRKCGQIIQLRFGMNDVKPEPICCGVTSRRLYSSQVNPDLLYQGLVTNLGIKPIEIYSRRQWKRELKTRGLTDNFDNVMSVEKTQKQHGEDFKLQRRKMAEKAVVEAKERMNL